MPIDPNAPAVGSLKIDLTPMASFLLDLPPNGTVGMRTQQDGYDEVLLEIKSNQAEYGDAAGITATDFNSLMTADDQYAKIEAQLPAAMKIVEILIESKAAIDDKRQRMISAIAKGTEERAKANGNDPTLLAKYERTRAYRSAIADKAAKTRKKNEEAAAAKKAEDAAKDAAAAAPKT
jgi:hypothetical protein